MSFTRFRNLEIEMFKANMTRADLSKHISLSDWTLCRKMRGFTEFKLTEMNQINKVLSLANGETYTNDYLFKIEEE